MSPRWTPCAIALVLGLSGRLYAQTSGGLKPTVSVGGSTLEFDYGGDQAYRGLTLRGGMILSPNFDVTVIGERWPSLGAYSGWAAQLEGSFYPIGRHGVSPYMVLGTGYFSATDAAGGPVYRGLSGSATSLALGIHGRMGESFGLRLEGVVRIDAGAGDDQLRLLGTYSPWVRGDGSLPPPRVAAVVCGMVRASGPWQFTEPGFGIKSVTPVSARHAVGLGLTVVHWQIPGSRPGFAGYLWDTRAVLLTPGWHWQPAGAGPLFVQAGPMASIMLEGPDDGVRGGLHGEVGVSFDVGFVPLTGSVGWMWITRAYSTDDPTGGVDQRALLVSGGIGF